MSLNCLFVFRRNRAKQIRAWQAGEGTSEFLYGLPYLDASRFNASFVEGDDSSRHWKRLLCLPLEQWLAQQIQIGFGLHISWIHWEKIKQADVIIATVDTCGLPLAMLKSFGLLRTPMIYISQGLAHRIQARSRVSWTVRHLAKAYSRFLDAVERILVLGEGAVKPLVATLDLAPEKVLALPFGTDDQFWTPATEQVDSGHILSVGSDPARDYPTLLRAIDGQELCLVTRQRVPKELLSETVHIGSNYTDLELRELYRGARFVVTPLQDVDQPSGQSATLQAMACAKAVILTRTRGLWEPDYMQHLENCYLVEPGDVGSLRQAIGYLSDQPDEALRIGRNARRTIEERYNSRRFAAELERHISEVLAQCVWA